MPANVLVVVVDGLRASALGAYGNTTYATPALDRLAAESLLLDWCYSPSPDLPEIYRALWHSRRSDQTPPATSLPRLFADAGYSTTVVTDEPSLSSYKAAEDFDEIVQIASISESASTSKHADDPSETQLAHAFSAATEQIAEVRNDKPRLVWLHVRGMYGSWDAPLGLQESLLDEDDAPPIESVASPDLVAKPDDDPDAAFRYACAYAAQVMVLDECLENLIGAINASGNEWLITVLGARGFPLGEHGRIGGVDLRTYGDQLQVPWMVRFPDRLGNLARVAALTSHLDLLPTLIDWINRDGKKIDWSEFDGMSVVPLVSSARTPWREATISTSMSAWSIRTAAWCLRADLAQGEANTSTSATEVSELYVRPDDRWEANDIAKLCPEVVEELRAALSAC